MFVRVRISERDRPLVGTVPSSGEREVLLTLTPVNDIFVRFRTSTGSRSLHDGLVVPVITTNILGVIVSSHIRSSSTISSCLRRPMFRN